MNKNFNDFLAELDNDTLTTILNKSSFQYCNSITSLSPQEIEDLLTASLMITFDLLELYHTWLHAQL